MKNIDYSELLHISPIKLKELQKKKGWALYAIGTVVYNVLKLFGCKPKIYYNICPYFEIGHNWGGLELGWFFICCHDASDSLKNHEVGHGIQNVGIGGLKMLALCIGSAARYWWRKIKKPTTRYDDWWFEGQATELGNQYVVIHKNK